MIKSVLFLLFSYLISHADGQDKNELVEDEYALVTSKTFCKIYHEATGKRLKYSFKVREAYDFPLHKVEELKSLISSSNFLNIRILAERCADGRLHPWHEGKDLAYDVFINILEQTNIIKQKIRNIPLETTEQDHTNKQLAYIVKYIAAYESPPAITLDYLSGLNKDIFRKLKYETDVRINNNKLPYIYFSGYSSDLIDEM